jgi:tRNA threonylcarbamoyladenosine biosynthesis protein TsaB
MKILALELSTARGSAAWKEGETLVEETWPNDRKNSALFFTAIRTILQQYGTPETIIVGLGPGSYAGIRIAISTAIGLRTASQARLIGLPSICAMQTAVPRYHVVGDARRQTFFLARIENRRLIGEPELMSEADLEERLARADELSPVFSSDRLPLRFDRVQPDFPSAAELAQLAQDGNGCFSLPPLQPMYLREPHITQGKQVVGSVPHS